MSKVRLSLGAVALACAAGGLFPGTLSSVAAQSPLALGERPTYNLVVPSFSDRDLARLMTALDSKLAGPADSSEWRLDVDAALGGFTRQLQASHLTRAQESRVLSHLAADARTHPAARAMLATSRRVVRTLAIGKTAPDIIGPDLDGATLRLSDYRGKVVVVVFSGDWCGICHTQYPYERLMLELYKNWPFAILGVDSDADPATAKRAAALNGLRYPAWFDGTSDGGAGPIAAAWGVAGWPATYVLDASGAIRFVGLRDEDLLKGVHQLLSEQQQSGPAAVERAAR